MNQILRVELTKGKVSKEPIPEEWKKQYLGSYGFGARMLYDEVPSWVGALDPENLLLFTTGPVTGTPVQTAGRHTVVCKSPLTGYFGDSSCGGYWGAELKKAGYDVLAISGRATKPMMILIRDEDVELRDATSYWNMDARESDRAICSDLGDRHLQISNIGLGGINMVRYAAIMHDDAGRAAGRAGVGAVMGHKNLHSVVVKGSKRIPVADMAKLNDLMKGVVKHYKEKGGPVEEWSEGGTPNYFRSGWDVGDAPAYNWADPDYGDYDPEKISFPDGGFDPVLKGTNTCYVCAIACRRVSNAGEGKYQIEDGMEGIEYENMSMLGSNCGIHDIWAINKLNDLCNLYGLDTISAGSCLSFAMECYENGLITKEDTGGVELKFGNADAEIEMLHMIAKREGFGNVLAEGVRRAARIIGNGAEKYAIHIKGMELAAHDPRSFQGGGAHYATTISGGRHTEGLSVGIETHGGKQPILGLPGPYEPHTTEGKGLITKITQDWTCGHSTMGWCMFSHEFGGYHGDEREFLASFEYVTGMKLTMEDALLVGERVFNLRKAFNMRHGCTRDEDTLPERLLKKPNKRAGDMVVKLDEMLPDYYRLRGWDPTTSLPTKDKLIQLGLQDLASDLWGH